MKQNSGGEPWMVSQVRRGGRSTSAETRGRARRVPGAGALSVPIRIPLPRWALCWLAVVPVLRAEVVSLWPRCGAS